MLTSILIFLYLCSPSLGDTCFDGDLYLFTFDNLVYQATVNGSISSWSLNTSCIQNAVANTDHGILLSCSDKKDDYQPTLMTISENKITNSVPYETPCTISPIATGEGNNQQSNSKATGRVWGTFQRQYFLNSTFGYWEGTVVSLDLATGKTYGSASFIWSYFTTKLLELAQNGTCVYTASGQYSFYDTENSTLYTFSASNVAAFDVSSGDPVFQKKWSLLNTSILNSYAYDSKHRMLYGVTGQKLYQFSIDNNFAYKIVVSTFSASSNSHCTMNPSNSLFLCLTT